MAVSTNQDNSQDKFEYHKITAFYEKVMYFTFGAMVLIASIVLAVTYKDRNSMREEKDKTIAELKSEMKDLKIELKDDATKSLERINKNAESELYTIKSETKQLAIDETKKELSNQFANDKIQSLIKTEAIKEVKGKVTDIVDEEIGNLILISDAASQMRSGKLEGLLKLENFAKNLPNRIQRESSKALLKQISSVWQTQIGQSESGTEIYEQRIKFHRLDAYLKKYNETIPSPQITNDQTYINKALLKITDKELISHLVNRINNKEMDLFHLSRYIYDLSKFTNKDFKAFEIVKINDWYRTYELRKK